MALRNLGGSRVLALAMLGGVLQVGGISPAAAQTITLHDQTFLTSNWAMVVAGSNVSSASAFRLAGAGVTGDARQISISGFSPMQPNIRSYKTDFSWTPTVNGAIGNITWEAWYKYSTPSTFAIFEIVARQGGAEYVAPATYREPVNSSSSWQKYGGTFNASNFTLLNGAGPASLDFTSSNPIQFGYRTFSTVNLPGSVTVQNSFFDMGLETLPAAAPEPSTLTLLLLALGAAPILRRHSGRSARKATSSPTHDGTASHATSSERKFVR